MPRIASQVVSLQANCSTHKVQRQKNSFHRKCCGSVAGSMSCHEQNKDALEMHIWWWWWSWSWTFFTSWGAMWPKISGRSGHPTNHSFSQKTRLNDLSYGIKIWQIFLPFCHNSRVWQREQAQLSQRDRAAACLNFDKNISANSVI